MAKIDIIKHKFAPKKMKVKQIIFSILLVCAAIYFGNKFLADFTVLSESAISFFGIILIVVILVLAVSRVLKA